MRTKVSTKTKQEQHAFLPGLGGSLLHKQIHKVQYATQIVGEVFERVSEASVGKEWNRLVAGSWYDVRPDLGTSDGLNYIESKATQHRFKCVTPQLHHYHNLVEDHAKLKANCNIVYFLWTYGDRSIKLVEHGKTFGGLVNLLTQNITSLHIVHWSIMHAMLMKLPTNVSYKEYQSWKAKCADGSAFKVMQFGDPFLRRLREAPAKVLYQELDLDPLDYELSVPYKSKSVKIEMDGVEFKTNRFKIYRFTPTADYVPFPALFHDTCDCPI